MKASTFWQLPAVFEELLGLKQSVQCYKWLKSINYQLLVYISKKNEPANFWKLFMCSCHIPRHISKVWIGRKQSSHRIFSNIEMSISFKNYNSRCRNFVFLMEHIRLCYVVYTYCIDKRRIRECLLNNGSLVRSEP